MSSPDRRRVLAFFAAGLVPAGCGFTPLYGEGGVVGTVALQEATDPESFAYRERLRRRLGDAGGAPALRLEWALDFEETGVAITPESDITRVQVVSRAEWRMVDTANGVVAAAGEVRVDGAYDATAEPFATRAARRDERRRLATELAELTAARALIAASGGA